MVLSLEGAPAGQVFVPDESFLVKHPNLEQYPADRYSMLQEEDSPKSAWLVLLSTHGRKLGIAGVSSTQPNHFSQKDLELFEHVSDQIAIGVENSLNCISGDFQPSDFIVQYAVRMLHITYAITST